MEIVFLKKKKKKKKKGTNEQIQKERRKQTWTIQISDQFACMEVNTSALTEKEPGTKL